MIHPNGVRTELFVHFDPEENAVSLVPYIVGEAYVSDPGWGCVVESLDIPEDSK